MKSKRMVKCSKFNGCEENKGTNSQKDSTSSTYNDKTMLEMITIKQQSQCLRKNYKVQVS